MTTVGIERRNHGRNSPFASEFCRCHVWGLWPDPRHSGRLATKTTKVTLTTPQIHQSWCPCNGRRGTSPVQGPGPIYNYVLLSNCSRWGRRFCGPAWRLGGAVLDSAVRVQLYSTRLCIQINRNVQHQPPRNDSLQRSARMYLDVYRTVAVLT